MRLAATVTEPLYSAEIVHGSRTGAAARARRAAAPVMVAIQEFGSNFLVKLDALQIENFDAVCNAIGIAEPWGFEAVPHNEELRQQRDTDAQEEAAFDRLLGDGNSLNFQALFFAHERTIARISREQDRLSMKHAFFEAQLIEQKASIGGIADKFETRMNEIKATLKEDYEKVEKSVSDLSATINGVMRTALFGLIAILVTGLIGAVITRAFTS